MEIMGADSSVALGICLARSTCTALALGLSINPMDSAALALKRLIGTTVAKRQAVADALGCSEQYLYQIANGIKLPSGRPRVVGRRLRESLDRVYPTWMDATPPSEGTNERVGLARTMSARQFTLPPTKSWEDVMASKDLWPEFVVAMPDDALSPNIPRGTQLLFSIQTPPSVGCGVLIEDEAGTRHIRRYGQGVGGRWMAQAINPAYASFRHPEEAVTLLAVMTWRRDGLV